MKTTTRTAIWTIAALGAAGLWIVLPNLMRGHIVESRWNCRVNVMALEISLQNYADENKLPPGTRVPISALTNSMPNTTPDMHRTYLGSHPSLKRLTTCLAGGKYPDPLTVDQKTVCSLAATNPVLHDALWEREWQRRQKLINGWRWPWERSPSEVYGF